MLANNVDCKRCHGDITRGSGEVPRQHCLSCHNEAGRLAKYEDLDLIHSTHVTKHKVECSECHIEITHSIRKITLAEGLNCKDCHTGTHENQVRLFVGASAVEPHRAPEPSPMYQVNVHCVGCHTSERELRDGGKVRATTPESCDTCHSPGYGKVLEGWRSLLATRLPETERAVAAAASAVKGRADAQEVLARARGKVEEVKAGHGVHNIGFAMALLAEAQGEAVRLAKLGGVELAVSGVPEAKLMKENECRLCHLEPPAATLTFAGKPFPHWPHARAVGACTTCHTPRSDHGKTILKPEDCARCHGGLEMPHPAGFRREAKAAMAKVGVATCATCHKGERAEACQPCHAEPPREREAFGATFSHSKHLAHKEVRCVACHSSWPEHGRTVVTKPQCTACHGGVEMPHPSDWAESHPAFAREHGVDSCEKCHAGGMSGEFCGTCHG
ncbi:MAG: cytochrome c3 family protein [Thermoanaerobaculum sp.]